MIKDKSYYLNGLNSVSPVDGRAILFRKGLENYFSERSLHLQRAKIQLVNLLQLSERKDFKYLRKLTQKEKLLLKKLILNLSQKDAEIIAKLDHFGLNKKKPLEHDVKASEYFVRGLLKNTSLRDLVEFAYFPFTSEDVNNIAYNLMLVDSINNIWLPSVFQICDWLKTNAKKYKNLASLSLTHGRSASPTTMGKRFSEFLNRFTDSLEALSNLVLNAKCSGPVGNHNATEAICPEFDYIDYAKNFVNSFGFEYEMVSNQRSSHIRIVRMFHILNEINNHLIDLADNLWLYILKGWMKQKPDLHHVGSSVMPHKVNPWHFESAQGYLEISSSLIKGIDQGLLQTKFERDLSDHPWERIYGEIIAYSLIAAKYILKGLNNLSIDEKTVLKDVEAHPEVLAEAIQIAGRILKLKDPYFQIKKAVYGKENIKLEDIKKLIQDLIKDKKIKQKLLRLTPLIYIGKSKKLANFVVERYELFLKLIKKRSFLIKKNKMKKPE